MSDPVIIGRVAVKVMPDTSKFREEAKTKFASMRELPKVEVGVTLSTRGFKQSILTAVRDVNAEIKNKDIYKVKIGATLVANTIRGDLQRVRREYQAEAKAGKKVTLQTELTAATAKLELDTDSLDHVKDQIDRWRKGRDPVKVGVKVELHEVSLRKSQARMALLSRPRDVELLPRVNKAAAAKAATALAALSGARVLGNWLDDLWSSVKNIDKAAPIIGSITLAIMGLAGWGAAAASNLFALSASLASIAPAGLALPGILGGIAIGAIASAVALKDFNKYVPAFAIGLGKSAKAGEAWKQLQDSMSGNFWAKAAKPMRELLGTLFPQFAAGMKSISTQLGGFFGGFATALTGSFNGALKGMFADLSSSITIFTKATGAMANIIKVLGVAGAGYLPELAGFFADLTTQFSLFIGKAAKDGRLQGWIDQGISSLKDLGRATLNVGKILAGLGKAAQNAGGSSLGMMADTLERVSEIVNGKTFQTTLTTVLKSAHNAMSFIAHRSGPQLAKFFKAFGPTLAKALETAGGAIGTLLGGLATALSDPKVMNGFTTLMGGIGKAVEDIAPSLPALGKAFGGAMAFVGDFLDALGPTAATVISALGVAIDKIAPVLSDVVKNLGPILNDAAKKLAPHIDTLTDAFVNFMDKGGLATVAGLFKGLLDSLDPIGGILDTIAGALDTASPKMDTFSKSSEGVGKLIGDAVLLLAGFKAAKFVVQMGIATAAIAANGAAWVVMAVKATVSMLETMAIMALYVASAVSSAATVALAWVVSTAETIALMALYAAGAVTSAATAAGAWIASAARVIASLVVTGIAFIVQGAIMVGSMVITAASVVASWVAMAVGAMANAVVMAAAWFIALGPIGWVIGAVVALVALIIWQWDNVKKYTIIAWTAVSDWVKKAWGWIKTNTTEGYNTVVGWIKKLPGEILGFLSGQGDLLTGAGKAIIDGFTGGLKSAWENTKKFVSGIGPWIKDHKGPLSYDKVLLKPAGHAIMDGLKFAMEDRYAGIRASLKGFTAEIASTVIGSPQVADMGANFNAVNAAMGSSPTAQGGGITNSINVSMMPSNSTPEDVANEILFAQKRIQYGSAYAM